MGGSGGGGTVVQQTSPWAANMAGQIGSQAAAMAGQAASQSIYDAMSALNTQYISASKTIQPYTQEGVQALDKLNSYIGLSAYNPGSAPVAPTMSTRPDKIINSLFGMGQQVGSRLTGTDSINRAPGAVLKGSGPGGAITNVDKAFYASSLAQQPYNNPGVLKLGGVGQADDSLTSMMASYGVFPGMGAQDIVDTITDPYKQQFEDQTKQYTLDKENYDYAKNLYDQYQASGPMTADQIYNDITSQPGYQSQLTQGIDAIQKAGSAQGYLGSGRVLKELNSYGQNTLSTFYGNTLDRLQNLANAGQQAATTQAGLASNQGSALASLYQSLGDTRANAILAGANSRAQAMTAANQEFKTVGGGGGGGGGFGQALGAIGSIASAFSSKHLKEAFEPVNTSEILDRVNKLDIEKWKYKGINTKHLGPYAGQFHEIFGIGDGQSINLIDTVGILLASVQELSHRLDIITRKPESDYVFTSFTSSNEVH